MRAGPEGDWEPDPCPATGRYRSGQTGQTVNLLALRLRWFESSPAHFSICWAELSGGGLDKTANRET